MAEESFHSEGSHISLKLKNPQFVNGKRKLFGFNFRVSDPEPYSWSSHPTASPPQTPPHNRPLFSRPSQDEVRRTPTTPVRHIEEEYTTYKTAGWTPPEQDTSTSVAGSSVVNTCLFEENPPSKVPPPEYFKSIPNNLSNQQRLTQAIIWSLRYPFDHEKPPTTASSSASKEAMQGKILAHQMKQRFMEELAKGNIEIQELSPNTPKDVSITNSINTKNAEKLNQVKERRRILAEEFEEWNKYEQKLNDKMAKFFEQQAAKLQPIPLSHKGLHNHLDHLDEDQIRYFHKYIENTESTSPTLDSFDINEVPTLMQQSLNTVHAFKNKVDTFERDAMDDLTLRLYKRSRIIPDDHEIPSVLDGGESHKSKAIETTEKILRLLVESDETE